MSLDRVQGDQALILGGRPLSIDNKIIKEVINLLDNKFSIFFDEAFWLNNINFSRENITTLRNILFLDVLPQRVEKYAFYFSARSYAIPESRLIFTRSAEIGQNRVHLFEYLGVVRREDISDYINRTLGRGVYIYSNNNHLFKLSETVEMLTQNKILFIKIANQYVAYDPYIPEYAYKDLYIRDMSGVY